MAYNREARKLENSKESSVAVSDTKRPSRYAPSKNGMKEGEQAFVQEPNKPLALFKKERGRVYKTYLSSSGNQIVDKNLSVNGNINLSGRLITKNYPAFSVYQSTSVHNQAIATGTWTRITLDSENYDNGSNFASNYFTAPYHGIYHFDAKILLDGNYDTDAGDFDAGERLDCALFKNAVSATYGHTGLRVASSLHLVVYAIDNSILEARLSTDLELDAGDYIGMYGYHTSGVEQHTYSTAIDDWTRFTGHLVCAI